MKYVSEEELNIWINGVLLREYQIHLDKKIHEFYLFTKIIVKSEDEKDLYHCAFGTSTRKPSDYFLNSLGYGSSVIKHTYDSVKKAWKCTPLYDCFLEKECYKLLDMTDEAFIKYYNFFEGIRHPISKKIKFSRERAIILEREKKDDRRKTRRTK